MTLLAVLRERSGPGLFHELRPERAESRPALNRRKQDIQFGNLGDPAPIGFPIKLNGELHKIGLTPGVMLKSDGNPMATTSRPPSLDDLAPCLPAFCQRHGIARVELFGSQETGARYLAEALANNRRAQGEL